MFILLINLLLFFPNIIATSQSLASTPTESLPATGPTATGPTATGTTATGTTVLVPTVLTTATLTPGPYTMVSMANLGVVKESSLGGDIEAVPNATDTWQFTSLNVENYIQLQNIQTGGFMGYNTTMGCVEGSGIVGVTQIGAPTWSYAPAPPGSQGYMLYIPYTPYYMFVGPDGSMSLSSRPHDGNQYFEFKTNSATTTPSS